MTSPTSDMTRPSVPRCISCGYVLTGLESDRCPECGRPFDAGDPRTFTFKPPFVAWWYWTPGVLLAALLAATLGVATVWTWGYAAGTVLVLPICVGSILGFGLRKGVVAKALLTLLIVCSIIVGLFSLSLAGAFCAACLFVVLLVPAYVGVFFGTILRLHLKGTQWDQRWHLPALVLILTPLLFSGIERCIFPHPYAAEEVRTTVDAPIGTRDAWNGMMFYEQVKLPAPWLLRLLLPKPLYTMGRSEKIGDHRICVYETGRLVKYITAVAPGRRLDFAVTEQTNVENQSVRLIGGSFEFASVDASHARITLSTNYEPLLGPRWEWRPFERIGVTTLHQFVIEGMIQKAEESSNSNAEKNQ
jgi:hypothetical protein